MVRRGRHLSLSSLVGGEARRPSQSGEEPETRAGEEGVSHPTTRHSLSLPKLWLSLFLIFLYLAKVPPSFFSRMTTAAARTGFKLSQSIEMLQELQQGQARPGGSSNPS